MIGTRLVVESDADLDSGAAARGDVRDAGAEPAVGEWLPAQVRAGGRRGRDDLGRGLDEMAEDKIRSEGAGIAIPGEFGLLFRHAIGTFEKMRLVHQAEFAHEPDLARRGGGVGRPLNPAADGHFQEIGAAFVAAAGGDDLGKLEARRVFVLPRHDADAVDEPQPGVAFRADLRQFERELVRRTGPGDAAGADRMLAAAEIAGIGEVVGGRDPVAQEVDGAMPAEPIDVVGRGVAKKRANRIEPAVKRAV
ncbi:MAG TPA: hypothetical protein VHE61_08325 [Opitutaceae bacterium]|nr:hypothetical protein [Opitutaceae bacterium]